MNFHPTAFVVLIPTASEYHRAGLGELLWWDENDYRQFKAGAMEEIRNFVKLYPTASCAEVLKKYYAALLSSPDSDSEEQQYPRSPNSVMEVSHLLAASPPSVLDGMMESKLLYGSNTPSEAASSSVSLREGTSPRTSIVLNHIERADSTTLYRKRGHGGLDELRAAAAAAAAAGEESEYPGVFVPRPSEDSSPVSPSVSPVKQEPFKRSNAVEAKKEEDEEEEEEKRVARSPSGLAGLVPLIANAAAMVLLSFVKGE